MDMLTDFKIRKASSNDVKGMYELGKDVSEFAVTDNTVTFWPQETLKRAIVADDVIMLVAEGDELAGFLIAQYNKGLRKATIENIFVSPDKRGQGIGDALLKYALEVLRNMGCEFVATLIPHRHAQEAAKLYENNGFRQGEEPFTWLDKSLTEVFDR